MRGSGIQRWAARMRRLAMAVTVVAAATAGLAIPDRAGATARKAALTAFAPNKPCTKVNAHQPRSTYDCVRVGPKLLWQNRGSQYNPFAIREPGSTGQPNPQRQYSLGVVMPAVAIDLAAVGLPGAAKMPIPAGEVPVSFTLGVTNWSGYLGDLGEPGVVFDLIDAAGTSYPLIGSRSCENYGDVSALKLIPIRRLTIMENVGLLCVVIPAVVLNDSLRLRIGTDQGYGLGIAYIYWRVL